MSTFILFAMVLLNPEAQQIEYWPADIRLFAEFGCYVCVSKVSIWIKQLSAQFLNFKMKDAVVKVFRNTCKHSTKQPSFSFEHQQ